MTRANVLCESRRMTPDQQPQIPDELLRAVMQHGLKATRRAIVDLTTVTIGDLIEMVTWPESARKFAVAAEELSAHWEAQVAAGHYTEGLPAFREFRSQLRSWLKLVKATRSQPAQQIESQLKALRSHLLESQEPSAIVLQHVHTEPANIRQKIAESGLPNAAEMDPVISYLLYGDTQNPL